MESEDDLQRILHEFETAATKYHTEISIDKIKAMIVVKEAIRCKIKIERNTIEQVNRFQYVRVGISSNYERSKNSGYLGVVTWKNRYVLQNEQ